MMCREARHDRVDRHRVLEPGMKLLTKTKTPRFHVITIDVETGTQRARSFRSASCVPSFIGVPDIFATPTRVPTPDWPQNPDGFEKLARGTTGTPNGEFFRHYFIFENKDHS